MAKSYATAGLKIYAQIDGSSSTHENIQPGCELTASWPSYYGDSTTDTVPNPYAPICKRQYKGVADWFDVWSDGWITDDGSTLHEAVKSCGIVTMWNPTHIRDTNNYMVQFALPLQAGNCVGKAIYESGGPYKWESCSPATMEYLNGHFPHNNRPRKS
ncbi:hypothetical protein N7536_000744 [Penicillium majusculum]|nr:hypothetical protein N7536_000744 [Penicillium majusculum]